MNRVVWANGIRFILLLLIQTLILRRVTFDWGSMGYLHILIYPLFILLLPIKTPRALVLLLAFLMGTGVDMFYNSLGVHASALVFMAYLRPFVMKVLEPYGGYNVEDSPTIRNFGIGWFFTYAAILLFIHIFFYFCVEAFSFVFIFEIMLNTIFSFAISTIIIFIIQLILRPKY
jgi:hypothetical protein